MSLASLVLPAVLEPDVHSKDEFVNERVAGLIMNLQ